MTCNDDSRCKTISIGKTYEIVDEFGDKYLINCNDNKTRAFLKTRFTKL